MAKPLHTRTRKIYGGGIRSSFTRKDVNTGVVSINEPRNARHWAGRQKTVSMGHEWPPPKGSALIDRGGPFYTEKSSIVNNNVRNATVKYREGSIEYTHSGEYGIRPPGTGDNVVYPAPLAADDGDLDQAGATAISLCKPTNSVSDASTFMGELVKEGLPSLPGTSFWQAKVDAALKAGDEFLNVVFGWQPMINEITKFGNSMKHADEVLAQYERDSGRVVRRRYNFATESDAKVVVLPSSQYPQVVFGGVRSYPNASVRGAVRVEESTRVRSFSGAFTYYLPSDYDSRKKVSEYASLADKLFGTELTPEVLWNLAPWSWAIDWFTNAGDVVSNISAFESAGLVLRYGYVMEHTVHKHTYRVQLVDTVTNKEIPVPDLILVTETKRRKPANPFGFGVTWEGLSPFQAAVAGALGISRAS